jgi:hypothetical protein
LPNRPRVTIIWEEPDLPESSSSPTALPSDDPYAVLGVGPKLSPATLISYGPYLGVPPFEAEQARLWLHTAQIAELEAQPNGMTMVHYQETGLSRMVLSVAPAYAIRNAQQRIFADMHLPDAAAPQEEYPEIEARTWLTAHEREIDFAGNRFQGVPNALALVEALYAAGAVWVAVPNQTLIGDECAYADTLLVVLPAPPASAAELLTCLNEEVTRSCAIHPHPEVRGFTLWWD